MVKNVNPRRHLPKPVQIPVTPVTDKEEANDQSNNKKVDRLRVNPTEVKEKARSRNRLIFARLGRLL